MAGLLSGWTAHLWQAHYTIVFGVFHTFIANHPLYFILKGLRGCVAAIDIDQIRRGADSSAQGKGGAAAFFLS